MNPQNKWLKIVGVVLNVLIAAFILYAGVMKVIGSATMTEKMSEAGFGDRIQLLGWGEIITALLLVLPWTSPLGALVASGFWGGVICINMAHHEDGLVLFGSVLLALTWIGAYLRGSVPLFWTKADSSVTRNTLP